MYSNAQYTKGPTGDNNGIRVDINGVTSFVPLDPDNADYKNIMSLVESEQLTIEPASN